MRSVMLCVLLCLCACASTRVARPAHIAPGYRAADNEKLEEWCDGECTEDAKAADLGTKLLVCNWYVITPYTDAREQLYDQLHAAVGQYAAKKHCGNGGYVSVLQSKIFTRPGPALYLCIPAQIRRIQCL